MSNNILNIEQLYRDFGIAYATEGGKHCGAGWVQIHCPFCHGSQKYHLGYNLHQGYFNCWRCGWHRTEEVLKALNIDTSTARRDYAQRPFNSKRHTSIPDRPSKARVAPLPLATGALDNRHQTYLRGRGFDPDRLTKYFGLLGTGPVGFYKNRILAPIIHNGARVSYQCRDITGRSDKKYLACMQKDEVREHQKCLYGAELVPGNTVVVVEGITDVWRLGPGAVAVFGIDFTQAQVLELKKYSEVTIMFDPELEAYKQANKLGNALSSFGDIVNIDERAVDKDAGDWTQLEADLFMNTMGLGWKIINNS